jgi:uncharacterized protein YndB with AHSA1/START domain
MSQVIRPAPVRKSIDVPAPPARAFEIFTAGFDRWWPRTHTIGKSGALRTVVLEPGVGGRWYGIDDDGSETDWGDVLAWEPPARLLLAWRIGPDWQYHADLRTEVEVRFTAIGAGSTRVDLEHRLLENMGGDAARARASFDSPNGWGAIMALYAGVVAAG